MNKFWGHLSTITKHRHLVIVHCFKAGIPLRGLLHDLSKYSFSEFWVGVKYYQGTRSPNEREREVFGYSAAWLHHKGRNKHHFEYWMDYNRETKKIGPVKMPLKYVIEMFCDRVAASKIYQRENFSNDHPAIYFKKGKERRVIDKETSDFLEFLLDMLAEKGEEETFKYIREYKKTSKSTCACGHRTQ